MSVIKSIMFPALAATVLALGTFAHGGEKVKIALAGDSTVANYKPGDNIAGWGQVIRLFLNDNCEVENLAVGGRSSKTFIEEGRWGKLLAGKPQFVLIQFGHNDSHGKDKPESTAAGGNYKDFLRKYADDAKAAAITPVFITPMHRRTFDKSGALTVELKPYADAMKEVAAEKGVFCIDLYESSGNLLNELGESKAGFLYRPSDRTHFSPEGAFKMAWLIANKLKKPESPLKDYCREVPLPLPAEQPAKSKAVAISASVHVFGVNSRVSMSFDSGSDGVSGGPASWMKENSDQRLVVVTQPVTPEWTKCHFTFTPKSSGIVMLIFMSSAKGQYICCDDVEIDGAAIENGDFETAGSNGLPSMWQPLGKPVYDAKSGKAHGGSSFVKCSSDDRLNRNITVEGGKPVTISFWIKGDEVKQPAAEHIK